MQMSKQIIILAGPNGAGKSTVQPGLVPPLLPFLNADNIARDLRDSGLAAGTGADFAAGRLLIARLEELEQAGRGFAVETNLANRGLAARIPDWQANGFRVSLHFIGLPDADLAVARVAQRVAAGGHDIPEPTIRRRFQSGLRNLFDVYIPLADTWRICDNASKEGPHLTAHGFNHHTTVDKKSLPEFADFDEQIQIEGAMRRAVQEALREHKRRDRYIVVWREGKIVRMEPEDIPH
jgi:predicted ABC-type ATPase